MRVDETLCRGDACGCNRLCTRIFRCPGLLWDREKEKAQIDEVICAGCGVLRRDLSGRGHPQRGGASVMTKPLLTKDPYNIVITGVGGQGNVMASRVLANMLVRRGFRVTIGETFGMSQRGGSVMSHLRVSRDDGLEPADPEGEGGSDRRHRTGRGDPGACRLRQSRRQGPREHAADLSRGGDHRRERISAPEKIREAVAALSAEACFLDATDEAIRLGNPILGNIVMIGAVAGLGVLPIDRELF